MNLLKRRYHEDWVAVFLGFLIIILAVFMAEYIPGLPNLFSPKEKWSGVDFISGFLSSKNLFKVLYFFGGFGLLAFLGIWLTKRSTQSFVFSFLFIALLAVLSQVISSHTSMKAMNLETVFFSVLIGLLIGNTMKLPAYLTSAIQSELYIKIGVVLLGTTILFTNIMKAGAFGLIQALVVVISVWYIAFWIARKLGAPYMYRRYIRLFFNGQQRQTLVL